MLRDALRYVINAMSKIFKKTSTLNVVMLHDGKLVVGPLQLTTLKDLGSGTYGVVKLVEEKRSRQNFAMKTSLLNPFVHDREIEILTCMQHPNIIRLHGFFFWDTQNKTGAIYQNLLFEPMPSDLLNILFECRKKDQRLADLSIKLYCFQMFRGLAYLHAKCITHRDIKPSNLLVDEENLILKISDFGCAKEYIWKTNNTPYMCSRYYRAPELVLNNCQHDESIDVWAAGCVVAECFTGNPIFPGRKNHQFGAICRILGNPSEDVMFILNPRLSDVTLRDRKGKGLAKALHLESADMAVHLLEQCFQFDPSARPTAWQACSHDFFDEVLERPDLTPQVFNEFESESMPREIRTFFAEKSGCQVKRSMPWKYLRNSEWKYWRQRMRAVGLLNRVRAKAKKRVMRQRQVALRKQSVDDAESSQKKSNSSKWDASKYMTKMTKTGRITNEKERDYEVINVTNFEEDKFKNDPTVTAHKISNDSTKTADRISNDFGNNAADNNPRDATNNATDKVLNDLYDAANNASDSISTDSATNADDKNSTDVTKSTDDKISKESNNNNNTADKISKISNNSKPNENNDSKGSSEADDSKNCN